MALSGKTFDLVGGAVNDLFAGMSAREQAELRAAGIRIGAQGTRLAAAGKRVAAIGTQREAAGQRIGAEGTLIEAQGTRIGAESTRLTAEGLRQKAHGDIAEAESYDLAAGLARQNEQFTRTSTEIKQTQLDRDLFKATGQTQADVAGAGFANKGSALDILRESASQGALQRAVLGQQGLITEAGYEEQAKSYETMAKAGRWAAGKETEIAGRTDVIAGRQEGIAIGQEGIAAGQMGIADWTDLMAQGELGLATQTEAIAGKEEELAGQTLAAGKKAEKRSYISAGIKGIAAIASIFELPGGGGGGGGSSAASYASAGMGI